VISRIVGAGPGDAGRRIVWRDLDGVLIADKPGGVSSNGFLQTLRRLYRAAKGGHGGTLDPLATGLLVVCFGEATKFSSWLLESGKVYEGRIALGARTTTADAEGEVIERAPVALEGIDLHKVAHRFTGTILQNPPMYSALKHAGQPLYAYARRGEAVPVKAREVTVSGLSLQRLGEDHLAFRVECGTGTYVRSLAEDIAAALGTVGHLASLRRLASGPFLLAQARSLDDLAADSEAGRDGVLLPPDCLPYALPRLALDGAMTTALSHGQVVRPDAVPGRYRVHGPAGSFVGVAELGEDGGLRPVRLMSRREGAGAHEKAFRS
jgi:tRNA pseudouridine55 synthase